MMRILIALPALIALGACQMSKDNANDTVSLTYNSDVAENAVADVGNTADNVADAISNDVQRTADKVRNTDIDVNVSTNKQ
ncbi:MAG: hypothetical protein V4444_05480 [Pseudomonadota bacterium]